ncbi:double-cubane-cluster-containing anaerobic reductase [Desulfotignum phosphitoxidans]|uniref:2-hydroxyglutaryl-CoA dehydratase D component HgdD n=1 Tax=Desulfotignum phosphitoxidans DSM 13687 TaxID=1286635 RepID=S0G3C3_9BACT|nr:double-cubane-cluster-containing anaerobic reductase [Desulfotignum phosphitoxidans]EMS81405.1 2-hydroxyglutaryl-CoA dehydratase D component HgdD [Desulfotignum phosphitoxidans DSM 13687]
MKQALFKKIQQITEQNLMDIEAHKEKGNHVIGFYCLYGPTELAVAADAIPLPLCGTRQDPIDAAEEVLPRNLCPLIKSSYGFAATDTCPFFRFSDMIVADTTCDGKKKMFEIMSDLKPVHVLQLPQNQVPALSLGPWKAEIETLITVLENRIGRQITPEKISAAIRLMNRERQAKKRLMDITRANPSPLTGMELVEILFKTGFFADKEKGIALMDEISDVCLTLIEQNQSPYTNTTPRILLTGVPVGLGSDKVVKILEQCGANVVALENCSGYKQAFQVNDTIDPVTALADQYLAIPCSVMSPNPGRMEMLREMIPAFSIDGVVDLTWQACHTYNIESFQVATLVQDDFGLPFLHIETDYSESDTEQLRVRIQAFIEMI